MKIEKSSRFQISSFSLFKAHGFNSLPPSGPAALSENRMAGTNSSAALRISYQAASLAQIIRTNPKIKKT
ncbi:MAG: hypothetical protein WAO02_05605 [Verrucomicrobiia bacterium]